MKTHIITEARPDYLPAYVSNGVIGLRIPPIPFVGPATAILNGFSGEHPTLRVESYAHIPYPLGGDIQIGDWKLTRCPDWARLVQQSYDFSCGELHSRFVWRVEGVTLDVEIVTFCSRSLPTLCCQEWTVRVDIPCALSLFAHIRTAGVPGTCLTELPAQEAEGCLLWESEGGLSRCGLAYISEFAGDDNVRRQFAAGLRDGLTTSFTVDAKPGYSYRLRQISSVVPDSFHAQPDLQAVRMAYLGAHRGFDRLREENRQAWAQLWQGRVNILGADTRWQDMVDAAFFYVHSSIHKASPSSTALFGLGQWSGYHSFWGHVFWDIETFTFPPVLLTAPDAARAMLNFRTRTLDSARANAAMNGYSGLQFPWQSGPIRGQEMLPDGASIMLYEHHITLDVAFAFAQFAHACGDEAFAREQAWPVLKGVAEWIESRVVQTACGWELHNAMGICEGLVSNNNAFVSMAAAVVLREASGMAVRLGFTPPAAWVRIAAKLYLPVDPVSRVIMQHDQAQPNQTDNCTETLAAFYPYTFRAAPDIEAATTKYYLEHGMRSLGWPMLPQLLGVHAARRGDREQVLFFLEKGCADYVFEPFLLTDEYGSTMTQTKPKVGPYLAHAGGLLMNCLFGLTGLQLDSGDPERWGKFPVVMPAGWDGIEVERIWVRGRPARLSARHGQQRAEIKFW